MGDANMIIKVQADVAQATTALNNVQKSLAQTAVSAQKMDSSVASSGKGFDKLRGGLSAVTGAAANMGGELGIVSSLLQGPMAAATAVAGIAITYLVAKFNELSESEKKAAEYAKLIGDVNEKAAESAGKETAHLITLRAAIEDTNQPMATRLQAITDLQTKYPSYFKDLQTEDLLNGQAAAAYNLAADAILRKARAQAAENEISKLKAANLKIELESIEKAKKANEALSTIKAVSGGTVGGAGVSVQSKGVSKAEFQKIITDRFNIEKKANQDEIDANNEKVNVLLGIALKGATETIKIKTVEAKKIKDIEEKSANESFKLADKRLYVGKAKITITQGKTDLIPFTTDWYIRWKQNADAQKKADEEFKKARMEYANLLLAGLGLSIFEFKIPVKLTPVLKKGEEGEDSAEQFVTNTVGGAIDSLGAAIETAVSGKGNPLGAFFSGLLKTLGDGLKQYGKQIAIASKLIQTAKAAFGTAGGFAAGLAIFALGAVISAAANNIQTPGLAVGARNFRGGVALVGERGPELVNLPKGSDVLTNHQSMNIGRSDIVIPDVKIQGQDLVLVFKRASQTISRNG